MRHRSGEVLLAALMAAVPQLGCVSGRMAALPGASPPAGEAVARGRAELPPDQAAELCLATARAMEDKGHDELAIAEYERALQANPRLTSVVRRLAVLYDRQGDEEHALAAYAQALRAHPKDADLLNDAGYFHYERGEEKEAEKYLRQALAINPRHRRAWINLGLVLGQQRRYEESYQAFAKVLTPAEARSNVGVILVEHGKYRAARVAFCKALAAQPDLKQARAVLDVLEHQATASGPSGVPGDGLKKPLGPGATSCRSGTETSAPAE